jgi:hypothetical protein
MKRSAWYRRAAWLAVLPFGAAGCQDLGLVGKNTPEAEAAERAFRYTVYEPVAHAAGTHEVVTELTPAGGQGAPRSQHWLAASERVPIPASMIRAVGGSGASTLYALAWDDAPYERLYALSGETDVYHPLHAVPPVGTPVEHGAEPEHGAGH